MGFGRIYHKVTEVGLHLKLLPNKLTDRSHHRQRRRRQDPQEEQLERGRGFEDPENVLVDEGVRRLQEHQDLQDFAKEEDAGAQAQKPEEKEGRSTKGRNCDA
jgi:hypothetical protein